LIERAQATDSRYPLRARVTYKDLCAESILISVTGRTTVPGIGKVLGRISTFEHENGRPLLSCLVVQQDSQQAGPGFAGLGREFGVGSRRAASARGSTYANLTGLNTRGRRGLSSCSDSADSNPI
jgi:hypothetical protein